MIWREPAAETEPYPGLHVHDGRVAGSITIGRTRLPLWAIAPGLITDEQWGTSSRTTSPSAPASSCWSSSRACCGRGASSLGSSWRSRTLSARSGRAADPDRCAAALRDGPGA